MVIEVALNGLDGAMRHRPVERIGSRKLLHPGDERALHTRTRIKNILNQAKCLDRLAKNIDLHAPLIRRDRHIRIELSDNRERLIACPQNFLVWLEAGNRFTRALEKHHFVEFALDDRMDLGAVFAGKPFNTRIAKSLLVGIH